MGISEKKMQIVINNYFKQECDVNTSIREAFEKGFRIGIKKALSAQQEWIPVTERLPEKDCKCRVTEGDFKSVIDCCWNNYQKQFEVWNYYHDDYVPITNVTAWKLIEKPYTEKEA